MQASFLTETNSGPSFTRMGLECPYALSLSSCANAHEVQVYTLGHLRARTLVRRDC